VNKEQWKRWEHIVGEKNESYRDELKHRDMEAWLVDMYRDALNELEKEGNPRAVVVLNSFQKNDNRGFIESALNIREWAWNIHHNTWGETSFAGVVKARVMVKRIQKGMQNDTKP
jgi:hemolysin-activating ACP:hemolysin acyltransferase